MASLNKIQLIGNVGKDPEVRFLPSGEAVANVTVATSEQWKDKNTGEKKEQTEWHRVSFFGRLAEIVGEYIKKGSQIYVEGSVHTRKYTDKDGSEKFATEIKGREMKMLGGRREESQQQESKPAAKPAQQPTQRPSSGFDDMDDEIPF